MTQENDIQPLAQDTVELSEAELAFVIGGTDGPGSPTDGTGVR